MKFLIAVFLVTIVVASVSSAYVGGNGQPGCKTEEELRIRIFRNNWDPTSYWTCLELNQNAIAQRCPADTAFLNKLKDCVNWNDWEWEDLVEPLSYPVEE